MDKIREIRRKVREGDTDFISSFHSGKLFKETLALEEEADPNTFIFTLCLSVDSCNLKRKTYTGIFPFILWIMDLPKEFRTL